MSLFRGFLEPAVACSSSRPCALGSATGSEGPRNSSKTTGPVAEYSAAIRDEEMPSTLEIAQ
jgi:hypothetical protein